MTDPLSSQALPIGVFDSGMGGLTVLRALRRALPLESFVYLGDTARLPYGTKSAGTVTRYAVQAASVLVSRGIKALVVACNTASAAALHELTERFAPLPVIGVLEPGARAAAQAADGAARVLVLATESTVRGGVYAQALLRCDATLKVLSRPSPLLVALAEAGRTDDALATLALQEYAAPALMSGRRTVLLLGCTHFPVFRPALTQLLPANTTLIDSAQTTAEALARLLDAQTLLANEGNTPSIEFLATDDVQRFARIGAGFLGEAIPEAALVDL